MDSVPPGGTAFWNCLLQTGLTNFAPHETLPALRFDFLLPPSSFLILFGWSIWTFGIYPFTERGRASSAVHELGECMISFRSEKGRWPKNLEELGKPELLVHEGSKFVYDTAKSQITFFKQFQPGWFKRTFTNKGPEWGYGLNLETVWQHRNGS